MAVFLNANFTALLSFPAPLARFRDFFQPSGISVPDGCPGTHPRIMTTPLYLRRQTANAGSGVSGKKYAIQPGDTAAPEFYA
ncbi:hypothetical protein ACJ2_43520 [Pantoea sp. QMID2]|nr:hypothetical protein ACJ3_43390 [Pantoea sp. QMID3]GME62675.1 hypothetical protein ACJ4_44070 [Pantoea sp. QMID4]GME63736.1 hypothetical protein ACJ2_43520 [Pantoea sp. QMID2]